MTDSSIKVPLLDGSSCIEFFPDELPEDYVDVIDVLRSEIAPLRSWRSCAVEYFRQDNFNGFDAILGEIERALQDQELYAHYQDRPDFEESLTEIFVSLAARQLMALSLLKSSGAPSEQILQVNAKCIDYIKRADEKIRTNEYLQIVKGFFEVVQGDAKRAEGCFKFVFERATKAQNASRKKFLFASLVGLGVVSFTQNRVKQALDYFSKAITAHPGCDASIRTAFACCCFKLEQFDRAKAALTKATKIFPDNDQLILWALLKLVEANKDRNNRAAHRQSAFEFAYLAHSIDPFNAPALNLLANHRFHAWQPLSVEGRCSVEEGSPSTLVLSEELEPFGISPGNQLRVYTSEEQLGMHIITNVTASAGKLLVEVVPSLHEHIAAASVTRLEVRNFAEVADFARRALELTSIKDIRGESFYILGKVAHAQGDRTSAYDLYGKALAEIPGFALAAFGAAQIMFASKEFDKALELFAEVLKVSPEDHDSLAYSALLRGMLKGEVTPIDKLREYAAGFQFDVDLWLSQAQLRHKRGDQADHAAALRCYSHAADCLRARKQTPSSAMLNNMGVLFFALGKKERALESFQEALAVLPRLASSEDGPSQEFNGPEITSLMRSLLPESAELCSVVCAGAGADSAVVFKVFEPRTSHALSQALRPGNRVAVGDWIWKVLRVRDEEVELTCPIRPSSMDDDTPKPMYKLPHCDLLADYSLGVVFNIARALEDVGSTSSAVELYTRLLQRHPSCVDCYSRLSCIARSMGQLETAAQWLGKAQRVKEDAVDLTVGLGEVFQLMGRGEEAKKSFEKIYLKHRKDPQLLVSQANYYYSAFVATEKTDERHLRMSYKFYYPVLQEHVRNVFAANGLAVVCAEKEENDAAREIFNKIRESNHSAIAEDVCINLAHVHAEDGRHLDAERLYLAAYKNATKSLAGSADTAAQLLELIAASQALNGREADARKAMLRAIHLNPLGGQLLLNCAALFERRAEGIDDVAQRAAKGEGAAQQLVEQQKHVQFASKLLGWSVTGTAQRLLKGDANLKKALSHRMHHCETAQKRIAASLKAVLSSEAKFADQRRRIEEEHQARLREQEELRAREKETRDDQRKRAQLLAEEQEKRLESMRDRWSAPAAAASSNAKADGGGSKKRSKKAKAEDEDDHSSVDDIFNDNDEVAGAADSAPSQSVGDGERAADDGLRDSDEEEKEAPTKRSRLE